jgi:integrase
VIGHAPKIKMMKEHGRHLRLDDEAERKLITGALACNWRPRTRELFRDIVILMRDTGMRNERELFRMRIENLDWQNRVIFVPDSKTAEGRRLVPMSGRVFAILRDRCDARQEGWVFPSKRSASGHLKLICNLFRKARNKAGLPKELVLYCARHDYGTRVLMRTGNLAAVMRTMGAPRREDCDALSAPGTGKSCALRSITVCQALKQLRNEKRVTTPFASHRKTTTSASHCLLGK